MSKTARTEMKLTYYKGATPNFGDDLNPWLWSKLLPDFFDDDPSTLFIGIGSILYHNYPAASTKVVFGSGFGGYTRSPRIDERWNVYFVRGPRTAQLLGLEEELGIGDAATLISTLISPVEIDAASRKPAFMPHWESAELGDWESVSKYIGLRYIDPRWPVQKVIDEILVSSMLVTEAMHGAIVADALRIPWVPFRPLARHHSKWHDWAETLDIKVEFVESTATSYFEALLRFFDRDSRMQARIIYRLQKYNRKVGGQRFRARAVACLEHALTVKPQLSSDDALSRRVDAMLERLSKLKSDYCR